MSKVAKIPQSLIEYFVKQQGNVKEILVDYDVCSNCNGTGEYDWGDCWVSKCRYCSGTGDVNIKLTPSGEIIWKPVEHPLQAKMDEYFKNVSSEELIKNLEEMGHKFVPVEEKITVRHEIWKALQKFYHENGAGDPRFEEVDLMVWFCKNYPEGA